MIHPGPDETLDRLSLNRRVLQRRRGHRSGTDDTLAAWQASLARPGARRVLDLGCGHATVTLLLSQVLEVARFVCVEYQAVSADLARRNLELNGIAHRATVVEQDLREFDDPEPFDLVTGTPPFMPPGSGLPPKDPQRAAARFELAGGIEAYLATGARVLAEGGLVCMLMDGDQDRRCRRAFNEAGLLLKDVTAFVPRAGRAVRYLGYVAGRSLTQFREHRLDIRDAEGNLTPAMLEIRRALDLP